MDLFVEYLRTNKGKIKGKEILLGHTPEAGLKMKSTEDEMGERRKKTNEETRGGKCTRSKDGEGQTTHKKKKPTKVRTYAHTCFLDKLKKWSE